MERSEVRRREALQILYGSLLPYIYTPCKPPARVDRIIRVTHGVCKHSRYSEVLLTGARGFYLSLLKRVFYVKILCLRAVISLSFLVMQRLGVIFIE
jgi:hypothetical protein